MKMFKPKYEITKYTLFKNYETQDIEQKIITSKVYTRVGLAIKLSIGMFLYDDIDYREIL